MPRRPSANVEQFCLATIQPGNPVAFQLIKGIPVWGEPLHNAIDQMANCLRTADRAALMADHHLGYAVPVGGVVAYRGKVSPSGVGFDIACFTGSQKIALADGRSVSFDQLVAEAEAGVVHYGFSISPEMDVRIEKLEAPRKTGNATELIEITLDNDEKIECTTTHVFFNRDGSEIMARDIVAGTKLMPLYTALLKSVPVENRKFKRKKNKLGDYASVFNPRDGEWVLCHHLADEFNLRNGLDAVSNGAVRHHVDFEKLNNNPCNIQRMTGPAHFKLHSALARQHALAGRIGFKRLKQLNPGHWSKLGTSNMTTLHRNPEFCKRRDIRASAQMQKLLKTTACRDNWDAAGQRGRNGIIAFNQSPEGRAQSSTNTNRPRKCGSCGNIFANQSEFLKHWHAKHGKKAVLNHSVVAIRRIRVDSPVPVFCLSVSPTGNFALAAGVFVHNCGNKAVLTDAKLDDVKRDISRIMDEIVRRISFGVGRHNAEPVDHALFDDPAWEIPVAAGLKEMARAQLGTVGSGNHYVDIFHDRLGLIWIGVHFGSRGLGHKLASHFIKAGGGKDGINVDPVVLDAGSALGQEYIACMNLAGRYAYAGRDWVCNRVAQILGATILHEVHNHHNFAWLEKHGGEDLWVVRKGATPAFPGQQGFVGGTMGEDSVILQGIESPESATSLYSTVHGAGRSMSRTEAAGKSKWIKGQKVRVSEGKVSPAMMHEWVHDRAHVELRGGGCDESPHAYKRLPSVLEAHSASVQVIEMLTPLGVAMAGENEIDPFKD